MSVISDQCQKIIKKSTDAVFDAQKIESFLSVCAATWHQDYYNQLLIWQQNDRATDVCGARAWQERGRSVLPGEKPIVVLNADFILINPGKPKTDDAGNRLVEENTGVDLWEEEPEMRAELKPVPVFDVSQTEGAAISSSEPGISILNDVVRGRMGIAVMDSEAGEIPHYYNHIFNEAENTLYLRKGLNEKEKEHEALRFLVRKKEMDFRKDSPDNFNEVAAFTGFILEKIFHMQARTVIRGVAEKKKGLSHEDKKELLLNVNFFVKKLMAEIEGIYLDFTETSAVNHLLDTDDRTIIPIRMEQAARSFRNESPDIARAVTQFYQDKATMATEGSLSRLYMDKWRMAVFTYPPYPLETEKTRKEGRS